MIDGLIFVCSHPVNRGTLLRTLLRLFWWKFNQIFLHIPAIIQLCPGTFCICHPESSYGSLIVYTTLPEYDEMNYVLKTLKSKEIFVDIGAGLGDYTLLASSKITHGKIISFEPHSEAWKQLQQNIQLNSIADRVDSYQVAVSDKDGFAQFNEEKISEISHIEFNKKNNSKKIPTVTLDSFLKKKRIKKIDLLKIDVEGAESFVLKGAQSLLKTGSIKQILLEINPNSKKFGKTTNDVISQLTRCKYSFFKLENDNQTQLSITEILNTSTTQVILAKLS